MSNEPTPLPDQLVQFIASVQWTFAKTMPEWPHEYIVRERVDGDLYDLLAHHIHAHGFKGRFYEMEFTYHIHDGWRYWVIDNILNRCLERDSYDRRAERNELPWTPPLHPEIRR